MKIPTFNLAVIGGSLCADRRRPLPFLMPLMMQVGFGKSAAASGAITFMSSAGSMAMKASAPRGAAAFRLPQHHDLQRGDRDRLAGELRRVPAGLAGMRRSSA